MQSQRHVRLFKNGANQALRIPKEFELPGSEAILTREGNRLIIEPVQPPKLLDVLSTLSPLEEDFPDMDAGLLPADEVKL